MRHGRNFIWDDCSVLASFRFLYNSTRGYRLRPWASPYVKWRIETYSGMKAEKIGMREVVSFVWQEKKQLFRFLRWTGEIEKASVRD